MSVDCLKTMSVDCIVSEPGVVINGRVSRRLSTSSVVCLSNLIGNALPSEAEPAHDLLPLAEVLSSSPCVAAVEFPYDYETHKEVFDGKPHNNREAASFPLRREELGSISVLASLIPGQGKQGANERAIITTAFAMCIAEHCGKGEIVVGYVSANGQASPLCFTTGSGEENPANAFIKVSAQLAQPYTSVEIVGAVLDGHLNEQYDDIAISPYGFPLAPRQPALGLELQKDCFVWHYDHARFHKDTIPRIHERLINRLNQIAASAVVADSDEHFRGSLRELGHCLPESERALLRKWEVGPTRPVCAEPVGLHHLFERCALQTPDKIAVMDMDGKRLTTNKPLPTSSIPAEGTPTHPSSTLTYGQLDAAANTAAAHLVARGCNVGHRVAVLVPRSLDLFVSTIAVLKCGAAYVPLDPTYPENRIQYILDDSACSALIYAEEYASIIPADYKWSRIGLQELDSNTDRAASFASAQPFDQDNLLTVLYTSGTTGNPKGVAIAHRNALVFMENALWDPVTADDVWAQMSNPCFIGSFNDIWLPLVRGAATTIVPKDALLDTVALNNIFRKRGITCLFLTPKLLEMYADSDPTVFNGLNLIQFAGEAVRADAVMKLAGRPAHLQHLYGCTERTGCISGYTIPSIGLPESVARLPRLPIGRPVENTQAYILDRDMARVPIGCPGELYIGGPQITCGYLNRENATREKFILNPFDGGKMYRTGDLARWLPDGSGIDLLGRLDSMVKLRGYRVELGEIETETMAANAGASAAVATTIEPQPGNVMLVVYVAPASVNVKDIRSHLKAKVPEFMVPTYICAIPAIPLNHNGKVDKRALPSPFSQPGSAADHQGPTTASEERMVAMWSDVLGVPPHMVGLHSTFAELGGNSFMAMRILSMLRDVCPAIQVVDIIENDTVQLLAKRMDTLLEESAGSCVSAFPEEIEQFSRGREDPKERPVFVVHGGSGLVNWLAPIGAQMSVRPLYGIKMTPGSVAAAKASDNYFLGMCEHYVKALRTVQPQGPYTLGGVSLGSLLALGMAVTLEKQGEIVDRMVVMDMPAVKFDKRKAYATATCIAEKAPIMVAKIFGEVNGAHLPDYKERFIQFEREMDEEILGSHAFSDDEAFVKMTSMWRFLVATGTPEEFAESYLRNLQNCGGLFIDPVELGLRTKADIDLAIAEDNRLIAHTLRSNGYEHLLADYGWSRVTSGNVAAWLADGDHVTMMLSEKAVGQFAQCFDRL